eukprot:COSAG02_NODE_2967_length_7641_cov_10.730708_7_plen_28_part_01
MNRGEVVLDLRPLVGATHTVNELKRMMR